MSPNEFEPQEYGKDHIAERGPVFHVALQRGAQTDFHSEALTIPGQIAADFHIRSTEKSRSKCTQQYLLSVEHNSKRHISHTIQVQESHQTYYIHRSFQLRIFLTLKTLSINGNGDLILRPRVGWREGLCQIHFFFDTSYSTYAFIDK